MSKSSWPALPTITVLTLLATLTVFATHASAQVHTGAQQLWRVGLANNQSIQVLVVRPPVFPAHGAVLLLPGGDGRIQFDKDGHPGRLRDDFLIRMRQAFGKAGYVTALVDAPSDRQKSPGLLAGYRTTRQHAVRDIGTIVDRLAATFRIPIFLIGTGRGAVSAANAARRLGEKVAGVALTAAVTKPNRKGATINAIMLDKMAIPTLFVHHVADRCEITPSYGARASFEVMQKAGIPVRWARVSGGAGSYALCTGRSRHGFWESEGQAVGHVKTWMRMILK